ncbi:MAG: hypothetical protein IKF36_06970, partial [Bacilli bacterium]|nr:hypothetical protein [Bacilli bacterium]
ATLLYESKYLNNNYMDVWVDKEGLKGNARIRNIINSVIIVLIAALIFYIDTVGRTDPMKGVLALSIITALFCIGFIMEKKFY